MTQEIIELIRSVKALQDCLKSNPNDPVIYALLDSEINKLYSKTEECYHGIKAA
jgi:hypothetical protein